MTTGPAATPASLLLFIHDLAPFGAQRIALATVRDLDRGKVRAAVCCFGPDETLAPEFAAAGAAVTPLRARRYLDPLAWLRLAALLFRTRPDLVQTNLPELSVPVRLLALLLPGTRVIHTVQNPLSSEPWYWRLLNRLTFFLCARVIFCSESLLAASGVSGGRYLAVQNGMESPPRGAAAVPREVFGAGPGERTACCVARLARQKGQDVLLRALPVLAGRGLRLRVLLAGDGEDLAALRALAGELNVADRVSFLGRRGDVGDVLAASDLYAAPSRWEGLGVSLGEAMLAGLPCVGTDIPGHTDILRDGETGLAVPPEDPAALAAAMARLLEEPQLAARLAAAGRKLIEEKFSTAAMAKKYERAYLEAAGRAA